MPNIKGEVAKIIDEAHDELSLEDKIDDYKDNYDFDDADHFVDKIHNLYLSAIEGTDMEEVSEAVHKSYCKQYKIKHGKEYWTKGDYSLLDDETKEFDRATVRTIISHLKEKLK